MSGELQCVVCSALTNGYNYGAITCNACKMFFRRVHVAKHLKECNAQSGNCESDCRFCRFSKCLQVGMVFNPIVNSYDFHNNEIVLSTIVKNLDYMNIHRLNLFNNFYSDGDPGIEEVTAPIKFIEKPQNHKLVYNEWAFMSSVTTIDFFKKIHFVKDLDPDDQLAILKGSFILFTIFSTGLTSYESKKAILIFPDGTEIPEPDISGVTEVFRTRIQGRVVAKLVELKLRKEEFLLLTMVFLCNPGVANLSDRGRSILSTRQKYYTSALFHHCLITNQKSGPSRFTDLLSIYQVLVKTFEDLKAHHQLRMIYNQNVHTKKIFIQDEDLMR